MEDDLSDDQVFLSSRHTEDREVEPRQSIACIGGMNSHILVEVVVLGLFG